MCDKVKCGQVNFYCSRKCKYGINLQAICDHNLMFRWIDMNYPGCASDYIAWSTSQLCYDLETNCSEMILPGCTLIGDSAYVKKPYMAVPIKKGRLEPYEDGYNYYLSQLSVTIECTFGVLVNRWSILRRPLSVNLERVCPLVMFLNRFHNYCIQNRLRDEKKNIVDLMMLPKDKDYANLRCLKQKVESINLDINGIPTQLLDEDPAVVDNPHRNDHTMHIPMNVMLQNCKDIGIERPNILHPRSKKVKRS